MLLLLVVKEEEAKAAMVHLEMIEQPGFSFFFDGDLLKKKEKKIGIKKIHFN